MNERELLAKMKEYLDDKHITKEDYIKTLEDNFGVEISDEDIQEIDEWLDESKPKTEYTCKDCGEIWETNGDRPKCPKCRSEEYDY